MKSLFFKRLTPLLLTVTLFAAINIQAMEQEEGQEPFSAQEQSANADNVVERIYNAFSKQLDERFTESPTNFREAIAQLRCIARLLEESEVELLEDFNVTQENCTIHGIKQPYHMLHPIFKHWFKNAYEKILLEHPKVIEAADVILERLSENVSHENMNNYDKAITNLPKIVTECIQDQFIDIHGWPHNIKPSITFNDSGVKHISFLQDNYVFEGFGTGWIHKTRSQQSHLENINNNPSAWLSRSSTLVDGKLATGIAYELGLAEEINGDIKPLKASNDKEEPSGVLPPLWEKPTFKEALKKRAEENKLKKNRNRCIIS